MSNRFNLCSPRPKKDGGTYWHRIGTAFSDDKGGFSLIFDSMPLQDAEGRCIVKAFTQKDGDTPSSNRGQQSAPQGGYAGADDSDDIPFGPEFR